MVFGGGPPKIGCSHWVEGWPLQQLELYRAPLWSYICLKCMQIAKIFATFMKSGTRNTWDGDVRFLTGSGNTATSHMHNEKYAIWPLFMTESPKFGPSERKLGSTNTMMTSDFRPEVEIQLFRACTMHLPIIIGTVRSLWTWLWGRYQVPQWSSWWHCCLGHSKISVMMMMMNVFLVFVM